MRLQEECQSCDAPILCSDWLIVDRCSATFQAGTCSAACFLNYFWHCVQIGHCIPYSSHLIASLSLGVVLVCVINVWLSVQLNVTGYTKPLCTANFAVPILLKLLINLD